jgi:hypothetical protein
MPATPFAMLTRVASGMSKPSVYFKIISFDTSNAVKERTPSGNAPIAEVPKPEKDLEYHHSATCVRAQNLLLAF